MNAQQKADNMRMEKIKSLIMRASDYEEAYLLGTQDVEILAKYFIAIENEESHQLRCEHSFKPIDRCVHCGKLGESLI